MDLLDGPESFLPKVDSDGALQLLEPDVYQALDVLWYI